MGNHRLGKRSILYCVASYETMEVFAEVRLFNVVSSSLLINASGCAGVAGAS